MPIFHVRTGSKLEFSRAFNDQFGDGFVLRNIKEAKQVGLFGPELMSNKARKRFGDFDARRRPHGPLRVDDIVRFAPPDAQPIR